MTGRGGAEGYLFTAVRVIPAEGRVEARGKFVRRKEGKSAETPGEEKEKTAEDAEDGEVEAGSPPKKIKLEQSMDAVAEKGVEASNAAVTEEESVQTRAAPENAESREVEMAEP
jgi:tRNA (adenine-N(1)-)-methyltransferase non-catalytic subunit